MTQALHVDISAGQNEYGHHLRVATLGDGWLRALALVLDQGTWSHDDGMGSSYQKMLAGNVTLKEIPNLNITFDSVDNDSILQQYAQQDRIELMKRKYASIERLPDYPDVSYGEVFYNCGGVNQVEWVIKRLHEKPESKSATITFHKAGSEVLTCISMLDFKVREGQLHVNVVYRSQNMFGSMPGNVIAVREIQEHVADAVGLPLGPLHLTVFSAHIYEPHIADAASVLARARSVD